MSRAWAAGSTRAWRRIRLLVLNRDRWICRLCGKRISRTLRWPHAKSATVHHTLGKRVTGDDPRHLVAAHKDCNEAAGDPGKHDPAPRPRTNWR